MSSPAAPSPSPRNPWPCARCGAPVEISDHAGRLPLGSALALLALVATFGVGVIVPALIAREIFAATACVSMLVLFWSLLRARNGLWRCGRCGLVDVPRSQPAGAPNPLIVIPTYNNVRSIAAVVEGCVRMAPDLPLLVVDDGSTDGTGDRAKRCLELLHRGQHGPAREVVRVEKNRGKGHALRLAIRRAFAAGRSHIITLDGDGQHHPEDIPRFREAIAQHPSAIVVGERDLASENVQEISRFGRNFSNFWLWVETGMRLPDSQSGFRAYPTAPMLSLGLAGKRYELEVECLTRGARAGLPLRSIPIRVTYPPPSQRVSHFHKGWDNLRISLLNSKLVAQTPLWLFGWPFAFDGREPPANIVRAWSGRSLGTSLGYGIMIALLRIIGPKPAYLMLYPVALYYMLTQKESAYRARPVLDAALGPATGWQGFWRSYHHVLTFSRCILDQVMVQVLGPDAFTFESRGREHINEVLQSGRGCILLNAHVGNNRVAGAILASKRAHHVPVHVVMLDTEAERIKAVYQRLGALDRMPQVIAINRGEMPVLRILLALRRGEVVAIHADRVVDENYKDVTFFGRPAPFPSGVFTIAAAAKVPVVLTMAFNQGPGRYLFIGEPPREINLPRESREEALRAHTQWFAERLEHHVRQFPLQWFNFYDVWKRPDEAPQKDGVGP